MIARASIRTFHALRPLKAIRPLLLSDIGEGIKECEVIQWFVEPEAQVQEFDKLCEVQSDKASVEITSRYTGVVKKLHHESGDMAQVGKPLLDIDTQDDIDEQDVPTKEEVPKKSGAMEESVKSKSVEGEGESASSNSVLATPAVRRLTREHKLDLQSISGSGRDGRVMKEDVFAYLNRSKETLTSSTPPQEDRMEQLSPIQNQMFKQMSKSLTIPHFLYADEVCMDRLIQTRASFNTYLPAPSKNLSYMPFFIKALSLALVNSPLLNARVHMDDGGNPQLVYRASHNIGIAMDTPNGLLVPNIKDCGNLSILDIANELWRLQELGAAGKLSANDLRGGSITISNIGSIGGTYVAPVVVTSEVAILGIGRARKVAAFDDNDEVFPRTIINGSWSADHRVVDGMSMARMASEWKSLIQDPSLMLAKMR